MLSNISRNSVLRLFSMAGVAHTILDIVSYASSYAGSGATKKNTSLPEGSLGLSLTDKTAPISSDVGAPIDAKVGPCSDDIEDMGRGVKDPERCKKCPFASTCMSDIKVRPAFPPPVHSQQRVGLASETGKTDKNPVNVHYFTVTRSENSR